MMLHNPNRFPDLIPLAKDWAQLIVLIIGRNNHPSRSASNINIQRWENTLSCTQYYLFLCSIFLPQTLIYIFNHFMHSYIFKNIPDDWRGLHPNKKFATKFVNLNSTPAELVSHSSVLQQVVFKGADDWTSFGWKASSCIQHVLYTCSVNNF